MGMWSWLVREGDTPDEISIKTRLFPFTILMLLNEVWLIYHTLTGSNQLVNVVAYSLIGLAMTLFMAGVLSNVLGARFLVDAMLAITVIAICANDLGNATRSSPFRSWAFAVITLDIALVFKRYHM
eukprot:Hpha_TRINITY_DN15561_c3_g5::TRINITY_DN15561_c3_g5_i2::g.108899::m.108899